MRKEIIIPKSGGDHENGHPLFDSLHLTFRVSYLGSRGRTHIIEYQNPYEVILGLNSLEWKYQTTQEESLALKDVLAR